MRRNKFGVPILVLAVFGAAVPAGVAASPEPTPGTASCKGLVVADTNHNSGPFGPSGNPRASGGPGVFLHQDTHAAIVEARTEDCGVV
jgi:hypothetical protein